MIDVATPMSPQQITAAGEIAKLAALGRQTMLRRQSIAGTVAAKIEKKLGAMLVGDELGVKLIQRDVKHYILDELDFLVYSAGLGPDPRD